MLTHGVRLGEAVLAELAPYILVGLAIGVAWAAFRQFGGWK